MQGPIAAVVLLLELTRHADALMVPMLLGVAEATVLARIIGAPSIYSARLGAPRPARSADAATVAGRDPPTPVAPGVAQASTETWQDRHAP